MVEWALCIIFLIYNPFRYPRIKGCCSLKARARNKSEASIYCVSDLSFLPDSAKIWSSRLLLILLCPFAAVKLSTAWLSLPSTFGVWCLGRLGLHRLFPATKCARPYSSLIISFSSWHSSILPLPLVSCIGYAAQPSRYASLDLDSKERLSALTIWRASKGL